MNPIKIVSRDEEWKIQQAIIGELRRLGWFVKSTHGNAYQSGFPDLFACHHTYGHRWIEVKKSKGFKFTPAQQTEFPRFCAHGSKIWVATTHIGIQDLLMKPSNWHLYLLNMVPA